MTACCKSFDPTLRFFPLLLVILLGLPLESVDKYKHSEVNIGNNNNIIGFRGLVLVCLMPLSTIFQLYHDMSVLLVEETGVPRENYQTAVTGLEVFGKHQNLAQ